MFFVMLSMLCVTTGNGELAKLTLLEYGLKIGVFVEANYKIHTKTINYIKAPIYGMLCQT